MTLTRRTTLRRAVLCAALIATLAGSAGPACAAALPAWGHELAQRTPDPSVRFGRLPNGLRYAIQHNETPKDGVAMRMRIGAGSLVERDEEQGLAHFLEHMAFRGSARVPDGEVVHMLQRQGLSFGPDTNAFTAHGQTVYMFNFPKADATALDTGLTLFREIGEHLKLDPVLVAQEKGVVLSEERVRDVPAMRAYKADMDNALAGTRFAQRWPIGLVSTIQAATPERLRRYYRANYRPDNATLVVVGNVDVDAVERQIRERFADWKSAGEPDAVDFGTAKPAQPAVEFIGEGVADRLGLTWVLPTDRRPVTLAVEREQFIDQIATGVLNLRLVNRTLQPGSPFIGAFAAALPAEARLATLVKLDVVAPAAQWQAAMDGALQELRRLLDEGVQPADLQRFLPALRSLMQNMAAQEATRQDAAIADALVTSVVNDAPYLTASQSLVYTGPMLDALTPADVTAALRRLFAGQPVVFRSASKEPAGTAALSAQLRQAMAKPLAGAAAPLASDWPYTDFGAPGAVTAKRTDAELGTTTVQFANGTRLVVKPTAQEKDKVSVQVLLGQGLGGIAKERTHALWALNSAPLGGTGKRSLAEFLQWQQSSGKLVGVQLRVDPFAFALVGDTRPADLNTQMQVLAAFARDPGFRPELAEKLAAAGPMVIQQFDASVGIVFQRELMRVTSNGEPRLQAIPTAADVAATRADDFPAVLREPLAGAADIVIVGDVSVDDAIAATQASFGAGPQRARLPRAVLKAVPPADGGAPHVATHGGRPDQAMLGWYWSQPDYWADPALSNTARVAAAIMRTRLVDSVREKLGITYSPTAGGGGSIDVPGQGSFVVQLETPTDKFDTFRELMRAQLRQLAEQPVSADELQRAKQPMIEGAIKAPQYNGHWGFWLPRILADERMKGAMLGETAALQAVTAEQVQAFFRDRILQRAPLEVVAKAK